MDSNLVTPLFLRAAIASDSLKEGTHLYSIVMCLFTVNNSWPQNSNINSCGSYLDSWNKSFKVVAGILNIQKRGCGVNMGVGHNHHNVGIGREGINEGRKSRVADFHSLELRLRFTTG